MHGQRGRQALRDFLRERGGHHRQRHAFAEHLAGDFVGTARCRVRGPWSPTPRPLPRACKRRQRAGVSANARARGTTTSTRSASRSVAARSVLAQAAAATRCRGGNAGSRGASIASTTAASRPQHDAMAVPCDQRGERGAPGPPPRTATERAAVASVAMRGSGVAGSLGAAAERAAGLLRGSLTQVFGVQALEVQRLQQERRETAGLDQVADGLARTDTARPGTACRALRPASADRNRRGEQTGLLHFGQVQGLVPRPCRSR